jgi:hypothetical protein
MLEAVDGDGEGFFGDCAGIGSSEAGASRALVDELIARGLPLFESVVPLFVARGLLPDRVA